MAIKSAYLCLNTGSAARSYSTRLPSYFLDGQFELVIEGVQVTFRRRIIIQTHFLKDTPSEADAFGTHFRIADELAQVILESQNGQSIALLGDWGSGKSTVVTGLTKALRASRLPAHVFIYDAWTHQGDSLRRSFLDDLIKSLSTTLTLSSETLSDWEKRIWSTTEVTETTADPMIRPHAVLFSLSLGIFAIGLTLMSAQNAGEDLGAFYARVRIPLVLMSAPIWTFAVLLVLSFLPWAWLRQNLFASNPKTRPNIFTFLAERTTGQVERKTVTSPADSVTVFKKVFDEIIAYAISKKRDLRILIVLDNIDRLPALDSREFWSTMQTFFSDLGTGSTTREDRYWLIAPFSKEHIAAAFGDGPPNLLDTSIVDSFIEKSFSRSILVPRPILASWREYMQDLIVQAFPEHGSSDRAAVLDVYMLSRSSTDLPPTPRQMKTFVNSLVGLFHLRSAEIDVVSMAAYLTSSDNIVGAFIRDDLLKPQVVELMPDRHDWRTMMAALHFGVSPESAAQILLEGPILSSLDGQSDLAKLQSREGFSAVLSSIVHATESSGERTATIAAAVGRLEDIKGDYEGIWRLLRSRLRIASWGTWDGDYSEGISAILAHVPEEHRNAAARAAASSFSSQRSDAPLAVASAANFVKAAVAVLKAAGPSNLPEVPMPKNGTMPILGLLATSSEKVEYLSRIRPDALQITDQLYGALADGDIPPELSEIAVFLEDIQLTQLDWSRILAGCDQALITREGSASLIPVLELVLRAFGRPRSKAETVEILKSAVTTGSLFIPLVKHESDQTIAALTVVLAMFAPVNVPSQYGATNAVRVPKLYRSLLASSDLAGEVSEAVIRAGSADEFLVESAMNFADDLLPAATAAAILVRASSISLSGERFRTVYDYARKRSEISLDALFRAVSNRNEILEFAAELDFAPENYAFFADLVSMTADMESQALLATVREGLLGLSNDSWRAVLGGAGEAEELPRMADALRRSDSSFQLAGPVFDALRDFIFDVARGNTEPTEGELQNMIVLLSLIPSRRGPLASHVYGWLSDQQAPDVRRALEFVGPYLALPKGKNADDISRGIIAAIAQEPSAIALKWLADAIEGKSFDVAKLSDDAYEDMLRTFEAGVASTPEDLRAEMTRLLSELSRTGKGRRSSD